MRSTPKKRVADIIGLCFWLLLTFAVSAFASRFTTGDWYLSLAKPAWTPPGWIFGPVWGLLYLSMALAAWLVWRRRTEKKVILPLAAYLLQLLINGLWSWLFFGRQLIGAALIDLLLLVLAVAVTAWLFLRIQKLAAILLLPYLLWICFATALNFQIWRLN